MRGLTSLSRSNNPFLTPITAPKMKNGEYCNIEKVLKIDKKDEYKGKPILLRLSIRIENNGITDTTTMIGKALIVLTDKSPTNLINGLKKTLKKHATIKYTIRLVKNHKCETNSPFNR